MCAWYYRASILAAISGVYLDLFFLWLVVKLVRPAKIQQDPDPVLDRKVPLIVALQNQYLMEQTVSQTLEEKEAMKKRARE